MYENFYKLTARPFENTPDPDFLFLSAQHREVLSSLVYGIESAKGFILVAGSVGTGKTTLVRSLLREIKPSHLIINIINPRTTFDDIFNHLSKVLHISNEDKNRLESIDEMRQKLEELNNEGKRVVILIDEAHLLSEESLEEIRLLSNIENEKFKLIQIVLVGQNEIFNLLDRDTQKSLKQRIVVSRQLTPLDNSETIEYINHRLKVAGCHITLFKRPALRLIWKHSKGTPRIINQICDNSMLIGYALEEKEITGKIVKEVLNDMKQTSCQKTIIRSLLLSRNWKGAWAAVGLILLIIATVYANLFSPHEPPHPQMIPFGNSSQDPTPTARTNVDHVTPTTSKTEVAQNDVPALEKEDYILGDKLELNLALTPVLPTYRTVVQNHFESKKSVPPTPIVKNTDIPPTQVTVIGTGDNDSNEIVSVVLPNTPKVQTSIQENKQDPLPKKDNSILPENNFTLPAIKTELYSIKENEWLTSITAIDYGTTSETLLDLILMVNHDIKDINRLATGQTIMLPQINKISMIVLGKENKFHIHYASFFRLRPARIVSQALQNEGNTAFILTTHQNDIPVFRVYLGSFQDRSAAEKSAIILDFKYLPFLNIQENNQAGNRFTDQQQENNVKTIEYFSQLTRNIQYASGDEHEAKLW